MSLNLTQILPQIARLGETILERRRFQNETLPMLREGLLQAHQLGVDALLARVAAAGDRWTGAAPTDEAVNAVFDPPRPLSRCTVIGADGSQVYPDRHAAAFYYLINIGSITITHGSQDVPVTRQDPSFFYTPDDLYDSQGRPIQPAMVNLQRDVAEMQALAHAARLKNDHPTLALLDNSLLLWMTLEADAGARREIDRHLAAFLEAMNRLREKGVSLAGYIDRPRNANTIALIHLSQLALEDVQPDLLQANPFQGLSDYDLFRTILPEGSRSARFIYRSPLNRDFEKAGHQIQYFYLNPGPGDGVVRVEIPAWVGEHPTMLDDLHAGLLRECTTTGGFPYVLVRAHELAVITPRERELLERQIEQILLKFGDVSGPSQKSITKGWTSSRRRHHL